MLLRARKYGLVQFEGEMLYQKQDDHVIITMPMPYSEIRRRFQFSGDPANLGKLVMDEGSDVVLSDKITEKYRSNTDLIERSESACLSVDTAAAIDSAAPAPPHSAPVRSKPPEFSISFGSSKEQSSSQSKIIPSSSLKKKRQSKKTGENAKPSEKPTSEESSLMGEETVISTHDSEAEKTDKMELRSTEAEKGEKSVDEGRSSGTTRTSNPKQTKKNDSGENANNAKSSDRLALNTSSNVEQDSKIQASECSKSSSKKNPSKSENNNNSDKAPTTNQRKQAKKSGSVDKHDSITLIPQPETGEKRTVQKDIKKQATDSNKTTVKEIDKQHEENQSSQTTKASEQNATKKPDSSLPSRRSSSSADHEKPDHAGAVLKPEEAKTNVGDKEAHGTPIKHIADAHIETAIGKCGDDREKLNEKLKPNEDSSSAKKKQVRKKPSSKLKTKSDTIVNPSCEDIVVATSND